MRVVGGGRGGRGGVLCREFLPRRPPLVRSLIPRALCQPTGIQGHFVEQFTPDWSERWSASKATKDEILGEVRFLALFLRLRD